MRRQQAEGVRKRKDIGKNEDAPTGKDLLDETTPQKRLLRQCRNITEIEYPRNGANLRALQNGAYI